MGCESWTIKKAEHQRIDAFELWFWRRLLRAPWTAGRSNRSILKEIILSIHWKDWCWSPSDEKCWLIRKDPDAGKDWRQEEKGTTEDKMVGWDHWLNGHEFERTPGVGEGQGSLAWGSPRGCKALDTTAWLNNNNNQTDHKDKPISYASWYVTLKTHGFCAIAFPNKIT